MKLQRARSWPTGNVRGGGDPLWAEQSLPPAPLLNGLVPRHQLVGHKSHNGPEHPQKPLYAQKGLTTTIIIK